MKNSLKENFKQQHYTVVYDFEIRDEVSMILADPAYEGPILHLLEASKQRTDAVLTGYGVTYFRKFKKGKYIIEINAPESNGRTISWLIRHVETDDYVAPFKSDIPVDSGQVGLFFAHTAYQPATIPQDEIQQVSNSLGWAPRFNPWFCYMATTSLKGFRVNAFGVCTDSGFGDGVYPAISYFNELNEVVALEVHFIDA